jgi:CheY-like chemotaxis protein
MLLWWGPQYISIYNDPYRPVLGNKHPWGLGLPVRECWQEIWHVLKPLIDTPFHGGPAPWDQDIWLVINRYGFSEETHWLIAYSPVPDESMPGGIGGVLATVHETTEKVLSERRMTALRDLSSRPAEAKTAEAACVVAVNTLEDHGKDIPFALLYLTDADGKQARLAAATGVAQGQAISPQRIDLDGGSGGWPMHEARRTMRPQVVTDLGARFRDLPPGPWPDLPTTAVVLPIFSTKPHEPVGFVVAGVSSRLRLDDAYRGFLDLVGMQIATAIELGGRWRPDIILCDLGMPGMDGYETCRRLRQLPGLEKVLIATVRGYGSEDERGKSKEAGFDRHLVKPIDRASLEELVKSAAARK